MLGGVTLAKQLQRKCFCFACDVAFAFLLINSRLQNLEKAGVKTGFENWFSLLLIVSTRARFSSTSSKPLVKTTFFVNLCNWHCSGLAMPSVPSPKHNWLPHSDQSPCYAACVPSTPSPRVPPTTAWLLSITSTSGPPTLPLLHLLSRGR